MLEALSRQFRTGVSWELLYANDPAAMADALEECIARLKVWKEGMESKATLEKCCVPAVLGMPVGQP